MIKEIIISIKIILNNLLLFEERALLYMWFAFNVRIILFGIFITEFWLIIKLLLLTNWILPFFNLLCLFTFNISLLSS